MARTKKPRLGRGLSSLMASPVAVTPPASATGPPPKETDETGGVSAGTEAAAAPPSAIQASAGTGQALHYIGLDQIAPNPHQPRQHFDEASLKQLAHSIQQDGLMQPVVLRPAPGQTDRYELVAGERRWRAAGLAELEQIPAIIRSLSDQQVAEWALVENLQREDLNPIERAQAFARLAEQFGHSHEQIAERVGIERPTVSNYLRLLDLHSSLQAAVRDGQLSAGHGRALGGLPDLEAQAIMGRQTIEQGWSVRQTEDAVRVAMADPRTPGAAGSATGKGDVTSGGGGWRKQARRSPHVIDLERQVAEQLQTKVTIKPGRKKGSGVVSIEYYSLDQFDALLNRMGIEVD